ncbi:hypothetical protein TeGR_g10178 [Tetraparma gracilis]|uniref:TOG domain-containing protein n=1 Tax=Tetraparma gracilis TaxID=2962635 RepID=A0ABQ6MIK5_9STRA|nr:hypothetical protein TeGR_g10178 [Tetraparma gracilis]
MPAQANKAVSAPAPPPSSPPLPSNAQPPSPPLPGQAGKSSFSVPSHPPSSSLPSEFPPDTASPAALPFDPKSSSWKTRKHSHTLLTAHLLASNLSAVPIPDHPSPYDLLHNLPSLLSDTNPATLESAVSLAILALSHSPGSPPLPTEKLSISLTTHALASSKASTLAKTATLLSSICKISLSNFSTLLSTLLSSAASSKRPKLTQTLLSSALSLSTEFHPSYLPLPPLLSSLPSLLAHSDGRVRETALSLLSSAVRCFTAKPFAKVIECLKPNQANLLEAELASKPAASSAKTQASWNSAPADVSSQLAAAESASSAAAADEHAARAPTDLLKALASSPADFKDKVEAKKWSERVEALKFLVEAAGPEPYKLPKAE